MANYEYQESDIMFAEHGHRDGEVRRSNSFVWPQHLQRKSSMDVERSRNNNQKKLRNYSLPICVLECDHLEWEEELETEERWEGEKEVVPPHLIVARRMAGNMEFSVCSGKGRRLKGRDLKEVRNEILRLTGFLEAN